MSRLREWVVPTLTFLGGCLVVFCLGVIGPLYLLFAPSEDEVARALSPSGEFVATVVEVNGGATTSYGYEVRVGRTHFERWGTQVAYLYGAVRSDQAYGVNLRWTKDSELQVQYLSARFTEVTPSRIFVPSVHVLLRPGINDPSAPPGGMLQNLPPLSSLDG